MTVWRNTLSLQILRVRKGQETGVKVISNYANNGAIHNIFLETLIEMMDDVKTCCGQMLEKPSGTISKKLRLRSKAFLQLHDFSILDQPTSKLVSYTTVNMKYLHDRTKTKIFNL